jgi:tRNA 2-thiocytidine biosynthesis protein TtcA
MQKLLGLVRRCVDDYHMIEAGDRIAVGVSGGKDSLTLLVLLAGLREFYPEPFTLEAVAIDLGLPDMDYSGVEELCRRLNVPFTRVATQIGPVIFEHRKEKNPCSMCAKMRRGALNEAILQRGITKVALGHHYDDAVETFMMSLIFEGRLSCFQPVTYLDRTGVTQIRPMLYLSEKTVEHFAERMHLPVVHNTCPADKHTKRQEIKDLIYDLSATYPDLKSRIFGAMQRLPLPEWGPADHGRRPLPDVETE